MLLRRTAVGALLAVFAACGGATETDLVGTPVLDAGALGADSSAGDDEPTFDASIDGTVNGDDSGGLTDSGKADSGVTVCNPNMSNSCAPGSYCNATGCSSSGVCTKIPAEEGTPSPVCGCNGVTYWNASVAAHAGVSVKASGECSVPVPCNMLKPCPTDTYCSKLVARANQCGPTPGVCWGLPDVCPQNILATTCSNGKCEKSRCEIMKDGNTYYNVGCTK